MKTKEEIFNGAKLGGIPMSMLLLNLLFLIGIVLLFVWTVNAGLSVELTTAIIIVDIVLFIFNCIVFIVNRDHIS